MSPITSMVSSGARSSFTIFALRRGAIAHIAVPGVRGSTRSYRTDTKGFAEQETARNGFLDGSFGA